MIPAPLVIAVWGALAALTLAAAGWLARGIVDALRDMTPRGRAAWGAGVLAAIALRLAAPWGPHDLNMRNVAAFAPHAAPSPEYGLAVQALVAPLQAVWPGPWPLRTVTDVHAILGGLSAGVLALWARALGASWAGAGLSAALLAVHPAHVRLSHTDAQPIGETLWTLGALLLVAQHARAPAWSRAVGAGVLVGLATHARPEAVLLVPVTVLALAAVGPVRLPWRHPATWAALALGAAIAAVQAAVQLAIAPADAAGVPTLDALRGHPVGVWGVRHLIAFDPAYVPALVALGALGLPLGRAGPRRTGLVALAVGVATALFVTGDAAWHALDGEQLGFARHQLRALPWLAVAQGFGLAFVAERVLRGRPRAVAAVVLVATAFAATRLPLAFSPRSGQGEFRLVAAHREAFERLDCTLLVPALEMDAGLKLPTVLFRAVPTIVGEPSALPADGCRLYYRSGECSLAAVGQIRAPPCDAIEAGLRLSPVYEAWLPAGTWIFDPMALDPFRVGLYRIDGVSAPAPAPATEAAAAPADRTDG